jgi:hypothetical protein
MAPHKVLLLGATGETGGDILEGLVEDGGFVSGDIFISSSSYFLSGMGLTLRNRTSAALSNLHPPTSPKSKLLKSVVFVLSSLILKEIRTLWHTL